MKKPFLAVFSLLSLVGVIATAETFETRPLPFILCVVAFVVSSLFCGAIEKPKKNVTSNHVYPKK